MARAKRKSDEVYNARRRAKRLLARMEREDVSGLSASGRAARTAYMDSLRQSISKTYTPRQGSRATRSAMLDEAREQAKALDRMTAPQRARNVTATARQNKLFERQINAAKLGQPTTLGGRTRGALQQEMAKAEVNIFYAATRRYWRGKDVRQRNELIMKGLGVSSLQEAYTRVLALNREALREARAVARSRIGTDGTLVAGLASENEAFQSESLDFDSERMGSPEYLEIVMMA